MQRVFIRGAGPENGRHDAIARLQEDRDSYVAFLSRRVGSASAEDILQTAYLRILERGIVLRDPQRLGSWFYTVLRNAALDHLRSNARMAKLRSRLASEPGPILFRPEEMDAEGTLAVSLIAELAPTHRRALNTVYLEGGSVAQLAQEQGISRNAATVRLHRARRALSDLLDTAGMCRSTRRRRTSQVTRRHAAITS